MHLLLYLPLLIPALATCSADWLAERLEPRMATWLLSASAVLLALTSVAALAGLAATAIGQFRPVATLGDWSVRTLRKHDPASLTVALLATGLLVLALVMLVRIIVNRVRALREAIRIGEHLTGGELSLLDDPVPDAYTLPGRIVISTGMLSGLDVAEQQVLLTHEQAHLRCRHHRFVLATQIAAATNPLLRPLVGAVRYTVERWADEHAARKVGNRVAAAHAVGKAALLSRAHTGRPSVALGMIGARTRLGPVPRRVAALLGGPPRRRPHLLVLAVLVLAIAGASTVQMGLDLDALFDLAHLARITPS
jgi:hypothetical protein